MYKIRILRMFEELQGCHASPNYVKQGHLQNQL